MNAVIFCNFYFDMECTICLEQVEELIKWRNPACHDSFCEVCTRRWRRQGGTCPLCRAEWIMVRDAPLEQRAAHLQYNFIDRISHAIQRQRVHDIWKIPQLFALIIFVLIFRISQLAWFITRKVWNLLQTFNPLRVLLWVLTIQIIFLTTVVYVDLACNPHHLQDVVHVVNTNGIVQIRNITLVRNYLIRLKESSMLVQSVCSVLNSPIHAVNGQQ